MENKSWIHTYFTVALCLLVSFHAGYTEGAQAQDRVHVQAEGMAAIGAGGRNEARQTALKDALQQAALSAESQVMSSEHLSAGSEPIQSLRVRPAHEVSRYSILREWEDQGIYHVIVSAEVDQGKEVHTGCIASAHASKKKIAFVKFDVANSIQVDDISNISDGLPAEFVSRLDASGEFIPTYIHRSISGESEMHRRVDIKLLAEDSGAQFIVSGRIVDAGARLSQSIFGSNKRNFEIEFSVYDGLTGATVLSRRLEQNVQGDVMVGRDKPFGSRAFFETGFGQAANRLVDAAVNDIKVALECLPFSAHIVRIEGKKVFLDAGSTSLLRQGDKLVTYVTSSKHRVVGLGGAVLGETESLVAAVTLNQIYPLFSIGELPEDAVKLGIKVGDIVRFESEN